MDAVHPQTRKLILNPLDEKNLIWAQMGSGAYCRVDRVLPGTIEAALNAVRSQESSTGPRFLTVWRFGIVRCARLMSECNLPHKLARHEVLS
jgi:hypothetical protein